MSHSRFCNGHYSRWQRYADVYEDVPLGYKRGLPMPDARAELAK